MPNDFYNFSNFSQNLLACNPKIFFPIKEPSKDKNKLIRNTLYALAKICKILQGKMVIPNEWPFLHIWILGQMKDFSNKTTFLLLFYSEKLNKA